MKEKIAVLMGGRSLEREVSLISGQRVAESLEDLGYQVKRFDLDEQLIQNLLSFNPHLVYIALHGKYGEDGTVQELLEILGLPYTGPDVHSCRLSFDKVISKELFLKASLPTPNFFALGSTSFKEMGAADLLPVIIEKLGLPLVVKPACQGSSLGIKIVHRAEELPQALIGSLSYDDRVLVEKYIKGKEIAVSILGNEPLPPVEIAPKKEFFDYEAMYTMGMSDYYVPARLKPEALDKVKNIALEAHRQLGCTNLSRVDFIYSDEDQTPYILEINTSPGMTETSLLPIAAQAVGLDFKKLVEKIVLLSLK